MTQTTLERFQAVIGNSGMLKLAEYATLIEALIAEAIAADATITGAPGTGTGNGSDASLTGGASGDGATGNGAQGIVRGGAALSTNGRGGGAVVEGGASTGTGDGSSVFLNAGSVVSGVEGAIFARNGVLLTRQPTPATVTASATLTAAQVKGQIIRANAATAGAVAYQMPLGTDFEALLSADLANNDAGWLSVCNESTVAAEDATITTNTGWTLIGSMVVESNDNARARSSGLFRWWRTGDGVFSMIRAA